MTDTGPGAVKGHTPPPCLNPFNTSGSRPLQAPPPRLFLPSQMGGDEIPGALLWESHGPGRTSGWAAPGVEVCVTAAGSLHLPNLHSLSNKMRMLTPAPPREVGPPGTEMRKWRPIADKEHPRSVPCFFPYINLSVLGACHFHKRETLTTHQRVHWPIPGMLGGRRGQPSGGPSPTPHQQSPSKVARTLLLAPQLFLKCSSENFKPTGFSACQPARP